MNYRKGLFSRLVSLLTLNSFVFMVVSQSFAPALAYASATSLSYDSLGATLNVSGDFQTSSDFEVWYYSQSDVVVNSSAHPMVQIYDTGMSDPGFGGVVLLLIRLVMKV